LFESLDYQINIIDREEIAKWYWESRSKIMYGADIEVLE
jgi:hypothetical protein